MKRKQKSNTGIPTFRDQDSYQRELGLGQERIRRKKALDSLKGAEQREVLEKAGQGNLFRTRKGGGQDH